jgi:hypothetical protein
VAFGCEDEEGRDGMAPGRQLFGSEAIGGEDVLRANIRPGPGLASPPEKPRTGASSVG